MDVNSRGRSYFIAALMLLILAFVVISITAKRGDSQPTVTTATQYFHIQLKFSQHVDTRTFQVPWNRVLVIEFVSSSTGNSLGNDTFQVQTNVAGRLATYFIPVSKVVVAAGNYSHLLDQDAYPVHFYADGGTIVTVSTAGRPGITDVTLSGSLIGSLHR